MKWPFVRRSKYENAMKYGINTAREIIEKTSYIHKLEDQIELYRKLHDEHAQLNHNSMVEINRLNQENQELMEDLGKYINDINRLNQELANELNSHRNTKKYNLTMSKELEETKDALKIAQEETRQHRMTIDFADEKEEKIKQYLIKVINYI